MTVYAAGILLGKEWDFYKWRDVFYQRLRMPGREVYSPKSTEECKDRLAAAVRKLGYVGRLEDYFDVPDQTFRDDFVHLTDEQTKRIKEIKLEYPDPIVALGKRLQIENGCLNGDEYSPSENIPSNKDDRILHYAEEFPRLIIWAKFTNQIKHYEELLKKKGYTVYTLTGDTKDREELFKTLRASSNAVLIAQAQISAGWEWPECPVSIFASRTYSVSDYIQAQGRIQRTNAIKKNLYINIITRNGIDEAVNDSLVNKKDFSERTYLNI
jgi:superfamily II DNA or RNA helicase